MRFWGKGKEVGAWVPLGKEEAHHARVARLRQGEAVEILDGEGNFWKGTFEKEGVKIGSVGAAEREARQIALMVGLTQGGTFEMIVRQAAELGVARVVPLLTKNSAPFGDEKRLRAKLERWKRISEEACKQSGNYWCTEVGAPLRFAEALKEEDGALNCVASLEKGGLGRPQLPKDGRVCVWVGPEGDFAPEEYAQLRALGGAEVSLGRNVLKVETACVAILAIVRAS